MMTKYLLAIGIAATVCSCTPQSENITRNVYMIDVSDSITPEITQVFEASGIGLPDSCSWDAHITRYAIISNSGYAKVTEYRLEAANQYFSNTGNRRAEVGKYITQLQSLKHGDSLEYRGSLIWESLCNELQFLSADSTMSTTLYLYSDLLEFNEWISFYEPKHRSLLKKHPEKVVALFRERLKPLRYTHHLELVIVHSPSMNTEQNEFFALIVERVYRPIMEELGIRVSVRSNC